jgi:protein subunit release factor B
MARELLLRVTAADCEWTYFNAGGHGGQHQQKNDTACRVVHSPSGARGESREFKSQLQNRRAAWRRMASSSEFRLWAQMRAAGYASIEAKVEDWMRPENLLIEYFGGHAVEGDAGS